MKRIGITGGSGAGKSAVAKKWGSLGAYVCNADVVYHSLLDEGGAMLEEIAEAFDGVVTDGMLDRRKLGEIVFASRTDNERLGEITHPYVIARARAELDAAKKQAIYDVAVVEALYLIESNFSQLCDVVVGVLCTPEKRLKRIMERDGIDREYAWARLMAQPGDEYYLQNCDIIIHNTGSKTELERKAEEIFRQMTSIGKTSRGSTHACN